MYPAARAQLCAASSTSSTTKSESPSFGVRSRPAQCSTSTPSWRGHGRSMTATRRHRWSGCASCSARGTPARRVPPHVRKRQTAPCPMCTMWVDGFNGVAQHVGQHADLVVVAAAELGALRAHARDRGWDAVRSSRRPRARSRRTSAARGRRHPAVDAVRARPGRRRSVRQSYSATPRVSSETRPYRGSTASVRRGLSTYFRAAGTTGTPRCRTTYAHATPELHRRSSGAALCAKKSRATSHTVALSTRCASGRLAKAVNETSTEEA